MLKYHCPLLFAIEDEDVIYRILKHMDLLGKDPPVGEVRVRGAPEPPAQSA